MKKILIKLLTVLIIVAAQAGCAFANFSFREMELRFVQISDTHISDRDDTSYKVLSKSKPLLEDAIKQTNDIKNLDFVVFTGDMVDSPLKQSYRDFFILASKLKYPLFTAFGNHDASQVETNAQNQELLQKDEALNIIEKCNPYFAFGKSYYAFTPKGNYRVIVLDTTVNDGNITSNGYLPEEQKQFLKDELEANKDKIILIFEHHPLVEPFKSEHHRITNSDEYMDIIKHYKKTPIAIFSGHYHAARVTRQGNIIHVSTPSLVTYPNAFRYIDITNFEDRVIFKIKYIETTLKDIQEGSKQSAIASAAMKGLPKDHDVEIMVRKDRAYKNDTPAVQKSKPTKEDLDLQKQMKQQQKQELKQQKREAKIKKKLDKMNEVQKNLMEDAGQMSEDIELLRQN